jgi:hypothetical protein
MHDDTKLSSEATEVADPSAFIAPLGSPVTTSHDGKPTSLLVLRLPDIWLPSGQVTASDGFIMDREAFSRHVKPGRYPLVLAIARLGDDERVAFAILKFAESPIAKWEMAVTEGQDVTSLKKDQIFGYGVDSGIGCFCDPVAQKIINEASDPQMRFFDRASGEMEKVYRHTRSWVHVETKSGSAALFSSGFGDGVYASYFGLDEAGNVAVLLTDFSVVDWPRRP